MTDAKKHSRRRYGPELKQQILAQCAEPGASVASIAMTHGINVSGWGTHIDLTPIRR